jgi:hypothetical protein
MMASDIEKLHLTGKGPRKAIELVLTGETWPAPYGRRGRMYGAKIDRLPSDWVDIEALQLAFVHARCPLGRIIGVETFCIDQRVGMPVGLLIEDDADGH